MERPDRIWTSLSALAPGVVHRFGTHTLHLLELVHQVRRLNVLHHLSSEAA
jgi:hypothetical protein